MFKTFNPPHASPEDPLILWHEPRSPWGFPDLSQEAFNDAAEISHAYKIYPTETHLVIEEITPNESVRDMFPVTKIKWNQDLYIEQKEFDKERSRIIIHGNCTQHETVSSAEKYYISPQFMEINALQSNEHALQLLTMLKNMRDYALAGPHTKSALKMEAEKQTRDYKTEEIPDFLKHHL